MSAVATLKFKAGDRIGRWTVLGEYELTGRNERKWLCRCDCGTERYVLERSLLYGGSESCGCLRKERALEINSPDLTGQQFGELKVIQKVEKKTYYDEIGRTAHQIKNRCFGGLLWHAQTEIICPPNPFEFGGIFVCWSGMTTALLIRSSSYI